jgi:hypothetical protein
VARVQLPTGCFGLEMADGTKYDSSKLGGYVDVDDRHAGSITTSSNGRVGLVSTSRPAVLATRAGRRCPECGFAAQAWTTTCPRCGTQTEEET